MNATRNTRIPAGLIDQSVEFFEHNGLAKCIYDGQVYSFDDFPTYVIEKLLEDMQCDPVGMKSLREWEGLGYDSRMKQWVLCRFGGFDFEPDIDIEGLIKHTEYFECGFRGSCQHEGKVCKSIKVENGFISKMELEVLRRVELPDKLIADELAISTETVSSHWQNIRLKTGKRNKIELAVFAKSKNII